MKPLEMLMALQAILYTTGVWHQVLGWVYMSVGGIGRLRAHPLGSAAWLASLRVDLLAQMDRILRVLAPIPERYSACELIFDTTLLRRWSLRLPLVARVLDTTTGERCVGITVLFALGRFCVGHRWQTVPLGFRIVWQRTRTEVLAEWIATLPPFRHVRVIVDGGLSSRAVVRACVARGWTVVGVIRRNLRLSDGRRVRDLQRAEWVHVRCWDLWVRVVPEWYEHRTRGGGKTWRVKYLFATARMPSTRVQRVYAHRWQIEVFHRVAKKELGLAAYKPRTARGMTNWICIVVITYAVLLHQPGTWLERKQRLARDIAAYLLTHKRGLEKSCNHPCPFAC